MPTEKKREIVLRLIWLVSFGGRLVRGNLLQRDDGAEQRERERASEINTDRETQRRGGGVGGG